MNGAFRSGLLLPEQWLQTDWFSVLATFVAINTLIYVVLGVLKILPRIRFRRAHTGASRRSETRSIHPDAPM
ncbi:hypothetical protein D3248_13965 [Leucobacter zeae]|nr:hypothetical protein [Leucobacter zeae]